MADAIKRLNYFDHQFLRAPDFSDEQTYHLSMRRKHNQLLHTSGIAQGLDATAAAGGTVVNIAAGVAIDSMGREMVVPSDVQLDLSAEAVGTTVYLTIDYAEQQSDPSTEVGGLGNTRWTEMPNVSFTAQAPAAGSTTLVLGTVTRTATSLGPIDTTLRKAAGVVVAGDLSVNSVTLKRDGVDPSTWPKLSCSGPNQAVMNSNIGFGSAPPNHNLTVSAAGAATGVYANVKNDSQEILIGVDSAAIVSAITASDLQLRTNNTTRVTVQANTGNVGIGTAAPGFALHMASGKALRIEGGTGAADAADYFSFGGNGTFGIDAPGVANGRFVVLNNGNVGIGSPAPSSDLHVNVAASSSPIGALTVDVQSFGTAANSQASYFFRVRDIGAAPPNGLTHFVIRGDGTVGIGNPAESRAKLEISGAVGNTVGLFGNQGISLVAAYPCVGFNSYYNGAWKNISPGFSGMISVDPTNGIMSFFDGQGNAAAPDTVVNMRTNVTIQPGGRMTNPMWNVTQVLNQRQGALPVSGTFNSGGGTLVIIFSGSGWSGAAGNIGMLLQLDGGSIATTRCFTNEGSSHKAFTTQILVQRGVAAGAHTLTFSALANTNTDVNDWFNATVLELPI